MFLSILLPTYNRKRHITRQLLFILNEINGLSSDVCEVLVSNNASSDETDEAVKQIKNALGGFSYYTQNENIGAIANVFFLLRQARGLYVWVLGDDDAVRPGTVSKVLDVLKQFDPGGVFLASVWGDEDPENVDWGLLEDARGLCIAGVCSSGLLQYSAEQLYEISFQRNACADWLFVSRCIVKRETYLSVIDLPDFKKSSVFPFFANLFSIRDAQYFIDPQISVYGGKEISWSFLKYEIQTCQMLRGILASRGLFSKEESEHLLNAFFMYGHWPKVFTLAYFMDRKTKRCLLPFLRLIWKNGICLRFIKYFAIRSWESIGRRIKLWGDKTEKNTDN